MLLDIWCSPSILESLSHISQQDNVIEVYGDGDNIAWSQKGLCGGDVGAKM